MLRKCSEAEYQQYVNDIYEIAINPSKAGYPSYNDGIKTKDMFLERSYKAFLRNTEELLLFEYEGNIEGWIHYYYLPEDRYLSTVSFNINSNTEQALEEFLDFAQKDFKGYDLFLGYSKENKKAIDYLKTHGFECIEDDYNTTAYLNQYEPIVVSDEMIRITKDNYKFFANLHSKIEGDMYWNTKRIYDDLENWMIYVKIHNEETLGSVYYMIDDDGWFEIFGIDMKDNVFNEKIFYELLGQALNAAKELNGTYMTFFCEKEALDIVKKIGFQCVDEYVCYKKEME